MLDVTKYPPSAHGFICRNCGGGDRGRVAIYRRLRGSFTELKSHCHLWCSRPTTGVPLAHATMNFVGLVLTIVRQVALATTTTTVIYWIYPGNGFATVLSC
ncbi:hypothetical protein TNCV_3775651 [Trichonephila clavipes]|nr:hypothetical protein TNCV_3775651 [Trichonephila clavipes]